MIFDKSTKNSAIGGLNIRKIQDNSSFGILWFCCSIVLLFYCLLPTPSSDRASLCSAAYCQLPTSQLYYENTEILNTIDNFLNKPGNNFHTSIQPYFQKDVEKFVLIDTLLKSEFQKPELRIEPLFAVIPRYDFLPDGGNSHLTVESNYGISLNANYNSQLFFSAVLLYNYSTFPDYIDKYIENWEVIPGQGYACIGNYGGYNYQNSSFYIAYQMPKYFTLEAGFGKNFWGDGYRSLILSQNAYNYPFFKITTNIWKLKYINLWANFKDIRNSMGDWMDYEDKFGALHFLSWNISKRLNIGIFDAIIWQAKDTPRPRYLDINYLNPIIFFRPVEFSLGSPDNAMVGLNLKFLPLKNFVLYSQLLIDDFLIDGLKDDFKKILHPSDTTIQNYGHWMNKQAFQLGLKAYDIFKIKELDLQTEFNLARPYTYSHRQVLENYGHFNQPLAHPLGANFWEWVSFIRYRHNRWFFETEFMYARVGLDSVNTPTHFGQNIYQSTFDTYVPNIDNLPVAQTHNILLQGIKTNIFFKKFKISYLINPRNNLRFECGIIQRVEKSDIIDNKDIFVFIGLRTALENYFYDF